MRGYESIIESFSNTGKPVQSDESAASVERNSSREHVDQILRCTQSSERLSIHEYLEKKLKWPFKEKAQLREGYLKSGDENRENQNSPHYETHHKLEFQRMDVLQATQWADQTQRVKINLCGESEIGNRLHHESQVRTSQELEEKQRVCYEEVNQVRKLKIEVLSRRQEIYPSFVSRLSEQIQDMQNQLNSSAEAKEFHDTDTASSSGASHVPSPPVITPSSRGMLSRDSGLSPTTRDTMG